MTESERLVRICTELEITPAVARTFVADYLALLDQRLARIDQALDAITAEPTGAPSDSTGPDDGQLKSLPDEAVVALLSLDASSSMLGAYEVALLARRLRIEVQTGRMGAVEKYRRDLRRAAARTQAQLEALAA